MPGVLGKTAPAKQNDLMKKNTTILADDIGATTISGAKTLLVVDDDAALRKLEVELLRQLNYNVLEAEGPGEAMQLAAATPRIHLLVTDFAMPEVNGLQLTAMFRKLHPDAPVLIVSGSSEAIYGRAEYPDRLAVLAKPFTYEELAGRIMALLNCPTDRHEAA